MTTSTEPLSTETHMIPVPDGTIFAQVWHPDTAGNQQQIPILLLHDSLGSTALWRDFPAALAHAAGRPVISYDRLGFGRSTPVNSPIAPDFIAQEGREIVPRVADFFQQSQLILFGHSVGGGMAVHAAAHHPKRCRGLITEAAQAFVEPRTRDGIRDAEALFKDPKAFARLERYHGERTQWVLDAWINSWLSAAFDHWSLDAVLPDIQCPTLVLHGEQDEYGSAAQPERLASGIQTQVEKVLLPEMHHVPHRENPTLVLNQITGFLARHRL